MTIKVLKGKSRINKILLKWLFKLVILFLVFYAFFMLINQHSKINEKKEYLNSLSTELELQQNKNNELKKISQASDEEIKEYYVKLARELNLSKHNEKIFVNISGNWFFRRKNELKKSLKLRMEKLKSII